MKQLYILLSRSQTVFARTIRRVTSDYYSHASLGLETPDGKKIYSFARIRPNLPFPGGMMREDLSGGYFDLHPDVPCAVLKLDVPDDVAERAIKIADEMFANRKDFHYNVIGTALCGLDIQFRRERHYFCSQFVADVLERSGAVTLPQPACLMRPGCYLEMPEFEKLYEGPVGAIMESASWDFVAHGLESGTDARPREMMSGASAARPR